MKKTLKIMAVVLFVMGMTALTSCTKSSEKMILGKWKLESVSASFAGQTFQMSVEELIEMLGTAFDDEVEDFDEVILEFRSDGYVYFQGESARYVIKDDKLIFEESEDESLEATITELTKTEMTLEGKETYVDEETGVSMTIVYGLYFKKV